MLMYLLAPAIKSSLGAYKNNWDQLNNRPFLSDLGKHKTLSSGHFAKVNGISDFMNRSNSFNSNLNVDFQENYKNNPEVFRRSKGACSEFASHGAKHAFISSPFGRR